MPQANAGVKKDGLKKDGFKRVQEGSGGFGRFKQFESFKELR